MVPVSRLPGHRTLIAVALLATAVTACGVSVEERTDGTRSDVDIRTPFGSVEVRADAAAPPDTGLPVYPGARPLQNEDAHDNASVRVGMPFVGVDVVAAQYQSGDAADAVLAYYRKALAAFGPVTECHGDVDFRRGGGREPVCRDEWFSSETQLVIGTESNHRIVSVKPRGSGTEFALVAIQVRGA